MSQKKRTMRRREFVQFLSVLSAGGTVFGNAVMLLAKDGKRVTREIVTQAEEIANIRLTEAQRDLMIPTLQSYFQNLQKIREMALAPELAPALPFLSDTQSVWMLNRGKSREG